MYSLPIRKIKDYYYLPEEESKDVGYPYGAIIYKSDKEYAFENTIVYSDVEECVSSDKYILVYQKPNKILISKLIGDNLKILDSNLIMTKNIKLLFISHYSYLVLQFMIIDV